MNACAIDESLLRWVVGFAFSLGVGQLATWGFLASTRRIIGLGEKPGGDRVPKRLAPWLTGTIERLTFTVFAAAYPSASLGPMMGWLALKLATNWNHPLWKEEPNTRTWAYTALLAGLISMGFAFIVGASQMARSMLASNCALQRTGVNVISSARPSRQKLSAGRALESSAAGR